MKTGARIAPKEQVFFTSTPVKHSYGTAVEVCVTKINEKGIIIEGSVIFGYANEVLTSVKVSPPQTNGRSLFFDGIFSEMVRIAEAAIFQIHGTFPKFSVYDFRTFF